MRTGIVVALAFTVFATAGWTAGSRLVDLNGDGFKEAMVTYAGDRIAKTYIDANRDGMYESVISYTKEGARQSAESDLNGDGLADTWINYYITGVPWKLAEDRNGDGKPDYWAYFKNGKLYKWEQDRNADGRPDVRTIYDVDQGGRALVQQAYDDDFDSAFERLSPLTAIRKQAEVPGSLAEALLR